MLRILAATGDWCLVLAAAAVLTLLASTISPMFSGFMWMLPSFVLVGWLYFTGFESGRKGATPLKRLLLMRVVDQRELRLTFGQATRRQIIKLLPFLAASLMIGWHLMRGREVYRNDLQGLAIFTAAYAIVQCILLLRKDQRALHDYLTGSRVIAVRKAVIGSSSEV